MDEQILLLERSPAGGDPHVALGDLLARCSYTVHAVSDVDRALRWLSFQDTQGVVIRVGDFDDIGACQMLRAQTDAGIVAICVERSNDLVVAALDAGADSAIVLPLPLLELRARISATFVTRPNSQKEAPALRAYAVGDLSIDEEARIARYGERALSLSPVEFRLLSSLARRAGDVVPNDELELAVWGEAAPDSLRVYIRYLRRKLGDTAREPEIIRNRRGCGYMLTASGPASTISGEALNGR